MKQNFLRIMYKKLGKVGIKIYQVFVEALCRVAKFWNLGQTGKSDKDLILIVRTNLQTKRGKIYGNVCEGKKSGGKCVISKKRSANNRSHIQ